jgi:hypothetical protein
MHTKFQLENLKGGDHMEDPGINGSIILEWILKSLGVKWIRLAQDRDPCELVTNLGFHKRQGVSLVGEQILAPQEGIVCGIMESYLEPLLKPPSVNCIIACIKFINAGTDSS